MYSKINREISKFIEKHGRNPQLLLLGKAEEVELEKFLDSLEKFLYSLTEGSGLYKEAQRNGKQTICGSEIVLTPDKSRFQVAL